MTADMFQGLEHLRILYLAGNDITRLMDYTFRGLQVKQIRAHMQCLVKSFINFENHFDSSAYQILKFQISSELFVMVSPMHIPCDDCTVTPMSLQRLQELHLQHNSIEMLADQALVGLTSLALLDLSRNNLHTIGPASLRPLVSLQVLRITGETDSLEFTEREHYRCALILIQIVKAEMVRHAHCHLFKR